ncbi:MAG: Uma2 family endonuclease [Acaryochloris sp. RU_4_1]|nr:Uma2 family endonuclease [Acaryochloris sp. RU_4_1]NJR55064.1 Uma2 family endonuclease [Acaryochloris sp. CRU_2_0]
MTPMTLNLRSVGLLTDEQFAQICQENPEVQFERNAAGELIVMPPTGGETGKRNFEIYIDLGIWNRRAKLGVAFDSSTLFRLPNGADRSPDVAWVRQDRWEALTPEEQQKFPPICPDFVVELRSKTDSLRSLQGKMLEYQQNGARLGWLINPQDRQVEVYRPEQSVEVLKSPSSLSGEDILPGFVLDLTPVW